jgi:hypothetical protein
MHSDEGEAFSDTPMQPTFDTNVGEKVINADMVRPNTS